MVLARHDIKTVTKFKQVAQRDKLYENNYLHWPSIHIDILLLDTRMCLGIHKCGVVLNKISEYV